MKRKYILIACLIVLNAFGGTDILTQGSVNVTLDDIDGFAYKILKKDRSGFFSSPGRIEKTLFSILNMKHIIAYGHKKDYIEPEKYELNINNKIFNLFPYNDDFNITKENKILLVRAFIKKEESYKQVQDKIFNSIDIKEHEELAEEKYIVNKSFYKKEETRDLDFISIIYNEQNKKEQYYKAKKLLADIEYKIEKFKSMHASLKNSNVDVEISTMEKFKFDRRFKIFSEQVFSINNIGIHVDLIDFNNRFIITNLKKINSARQLSFEDVKEKILEEIMVKMAEKKFNSILISLTQDKVVVNEETLGLLRDRYRD